MDVIQEDLHPLTLPLTMKDPHSAQVTGLSSIPTRIVAETFRENITFPRSRLHDDAVLIR